MILVYNKRKSKKFLYSKRGKDTFQMSFESVKVFYEPLFSKQGRMILYLRKDRGNNT